MAEINPELEFRFIKLLLSSTLKTMDALHADIDVHASVRGHMLGICDGVRSRALEAAGDDISPEQATGHVDALITMINEYFDYSASPHFGGVDLVERQG